MNDTQDTSLPLSASLYCGILLPIFVFALAILQIILLYGEWNAFNKALQAGTVLSLFSALSYAMAEFWIYPKAKQKNALSLAYFSSFVLLSAAYFYFASATDFSFSFPSRGETARTLFLAVGFRLCVTNVIALLLRMGVEIVRYIKGILRS